MDFSHFQQPVPFQELTKKIMKPRLRKITFIIICARPQYKSWPQRLVLIKYFLYSLTLWGGLCIVSEGKKAIFLPGRWVGHAELPHIWISEGVPRSVYPSVWYNINLVCANKFIKIAGACSTFVTACPKVNIYGFALPTSLFLWGTFVC